MVDDEKGFGSTTLEFKISFVRPITPDTGQMKAEGIVLTMGRRIGTAEGRLTDRPAAFSRTARRPASSSNGSHRRRATAHAGPRSRNDK